MTANELIEAYVADVAVQLPRKQRNDVAFELRALLQEELQAKADAAGRGADAALAMDLLQAFGRPGDVAARYRPSLIIIEPEDGYSFLRATLIGLGLIWGMGLLMHLRQPIATGPDLFRVLGHWWGNTVLPSLSWPGMLVVGFGLSSWVRRRWPQSTAWTPRSGEHMTGGRAGLVLGIVGILAGVFVLLDPHWILDFFWNGRAAPEAYAALSYTEPFLQRQAPWLLLLILSNIPIMITVIVQGRRSAAIQRLETVLALLTCLLMVWTVLDGPAFMTPVSDRTFKTLLLLLTAMSLIQLGFERYRRVRPRPDPAV